MVSSPKLWQKKKPPPLAGATLLHVLNGGVRLPVWEHWIAEHGPHALDVSHGLNFSTLDQAINAAIAGAGVVIVDEAMVVRELQSGLLLRHNKQKVEGPFGYWLVTPQSQTPTPQRVLDFRGWLMEHAAA